MYSLSSLISQVRTCIIETEFDKAFDLLNNPIILKAAPFANDLTLLGSRYNSWKRANLRGHDQKEEFNAIIDLLIKVVDQIEKSEKPFSQFGLLSLRKNLIEKIEHLKEGEVEINGSANVMTAYLGGLQKARWRFYTTSYLDSEFWSNFLDSEIRRQNSDLLKRIQSSSESRANYRRLFIIDDDIDNYIDNIVNRAISYKRIGDQSIDQNFKRSIETLRSLHTQAMEMQIAPLKDISMHTPLLRGIRSDSPLELNPKKINIEFAIFDDFRVDIYYLDDRKRIRKVVIFTAANPNFEGILSSCEEYFLKIWSLQETLSMDNYFAKVSEHQFDQEDIDIDYDRAWLINYIVVSERDFAIASEKESVMGFLKNQKLEFENYLDVGVCTARYPVALRDANFVKNIDSIDKDYDVAEFMQNYKRDINFIQYDIRLPKVVERLKKKYDLITCMVSTPSHFGLYTQRPRFNNRIGFLQALINMAQLLHKKGIMILSFWSNWDHLRKIELYSDDKFSRIKQNTPSREEIDRFIAKENLSLKFVDTIDNQNFNIFVYQKID